MLDHTRIALGAALALAVAGCGADDAGHAGAADMGRWSADMSGPYDGSFGGGADAGSDGGSGAPVDDEEPEPEPGDRFEDVGTNPFTRAAHDPFSTFAADVDTASYDIFVRDVGLYGTLPNPTSVRLEEYVNAFPYAYPTPEPGAEVPFAIDLDWGAHPMAREGRTLLRVGIQASAPPELVKLPTNLVFLVDVSGSMSTRDKLPLVQRLLTRALDELDETDTISIVTYAGRVGVRLPPTNARERDTIAEAIANLSAGGSTAGAAGIDLAYAQAEAGFVEGGFNHVVLCTDGDFNVGASTDDALVELIEEKRETGVTPTALGFGRGNLNDAMMERVSNAGNGIYSVIASEAHADRYASESLLQTITFVAKDMKIQVEFNPEHVEGYRLLGYENRAIADDDFRNDVVDAGEVGAGHRVTALYEVVLAGDALPEVEGAPIVEGEPVEGEREVAAGDIVLVKVRWKERTASAEDPAMETAATLAPTDLQSELVDPDTRFASAVAALAEILKGSPFADEGDLDAIEETFGAQASRDERRAELAELFRTARGLLGR
ncbi:MAG: von Willebrand factor type A domain-containing protein [Myxococcota bacterium]